MQSIRIIESKHTYVLYNISIAITESLMRLTKRSNYVWFKTTFWYSPSWEEAAAAPLTGKKKG